MKPIFALYGAALLVSTSGAALPHSTLAVRTPHGWQTFWTSDRAPVHWSAPSATLAAGIEWHASRPGVAWSEAALAGSGEAWRTRLVLIRLDPRHLRFRLDTAFAPDHAPAWRVERARRDVVFAVNAGQFVHTLPWGGVVLDGREFLDAGHGPLAATIVFDSTGAVQFTAGDSLPRRGGIAWAFQSYPLLLVHGDIPAPLRDAGAATSIDLAHRDARAAIGILPDGRILVALTRFDALGGALGFVPFGLTTPEMAAVMGAAGARDAVMLDGGISAQAIVRDANGTAHAWPGVRAVPLALVAVTR